jgi:hypothetical protein
MAEFCLECFNKHVLPAGERPRREKDVTLTDWLETCEGCGELKRTVIVDQPEPLIRKLFFRLLFKLYDFWHRRKEK